MHLLILSAVLSISVADQLDGTEIGDATQYIAFQSHGKYVAEREDKVAGKTHAKGTWAVTGNKLEVKIASCKGPACKTLGQSYTSDIEIVAERALAVHTTPNDVPLSSGSYYCRFQGCEKRTGVELVTNAGRSVVMKYLVDYLVDKNRSRDVTVVWWGKKHGEKAPRSQVFYCPRDGERGKKGAELVQKDLGELPWMGKVEAKPSPEKDCLYDVKVIVADDVTLPPRR